MAELKASDPAPLLVKCKNRYFKAVLPAHLQQMLSSSPTDEKSSNHSTIQRSSFTENNYKYPGAKRRGSLDSECSTFHTNTTLPNASFMNGLTLAQERQKQQGTNVRDKPLQKRLRLSHGRAAAGKRSHAIWRIDPIERMRLQKDISPQRPKTSQFNHKRRASVQVQMQDTLPTLVTKAQRQFSMSRNSITTCEETEEAQKETSMPTPTIPKTLRNNNYQRPSSVTGDKRRKYERESSSVSSKHNSTIRRLRESELRDSRQSDSHSSFLTQSISFKSVSSVSITSESLPSVITIDKRSMQRSKFYTKPTHTTKLTETLLSGPLEPMNNLGSVTRVNQFISHSKHQQFKFRKRNLKRYGDAKFEVESSSSLVPTKPVFASESKLVYKRYKTNLCTRSHEHLNVKLKDKSLLMRIDHDASHRLIEREWSLGCVFDTSRVIEPCTTRFYQLSLAREVSPLIINYLNLNAKRKKKASSLKSFSTQINSHLRKFIGHSTNFLDLEERMPATLRCNTFKETDEPLIDQEFVQWKSQNIERVFSLPQHSLQVKQECQSRAHLERTKTLSKKSSNTHKFPLLILNIDPFLNRNHQYEVFVKRKSVTDKKLQYCFIEEALEFSEELQEKILSILFKQSKRNLFKISNKSRNKADQTGISHLHSEGPQTEIMSPELSLQMIQNKCVLHEQINRMLPDVDTMEDLFQKRNAIYPLQKILRPGSWSKKFNKLYKELRHQTKWNIKVSESPRGYSRMGTFSEVMEPKMLDVIVEKKLVSDKTKIHGEYEYHALLNINQHNKPIFIYKPVHQEVIPQKKGKAIRNMIECGPQTLVSESSEELSSDSDYSGEIVQNNSMKRKYSHQYQSSNFLKLNYPLKRVITSFTGKLPQEQSFDFDENEEEEESSQSKESVKIEIKIKNQSSKTMFKVDNRSINSSSISSQTGEEVRPIAHYRHKRFSIQSKVELL